MPWTDEGGWWLPLRRDQRFLEDDALIARGDHAITAKPLPGGAHRSGRMRDLIAAPFALPHNAAQQAKRRKEEVSDEVWLQTPGGGALHLRAYLLRLGEVKRLLGKRTLRQQRTQVVAVERRIQCAIEPRPHIRLVAIAN